MTSVRSLGCPREVSKTAIDPGGATEPFIGAHSAIDRVGSTPTSPADIDAYELGSLAGHLAMEPLLDAVIVMADEVRAEFAQRVGSFARGHLVDWAKLVTEVRSGEVDQRTRRVPGTAFRPTFHSRQAADHLQAERWTEAFARYCMAGEFLIRDVILPKVKSATGVTDPVPAKNAWWRSDFVKVTGDLGFDVKHRAEFKEFERIYGLRNEAILHGHREASMAEAVAAKRAFQGLQLLLGELFAAKPGVTLDRLQDEELSARTMLWTSDELTHIRDFAAELQTFVHQAAAQLKSIVSGHQLRRPESLVNAIGALSPSELAIADRAFAGAVEADFGLLGRIFSQAVNGDAMLIEAVNGIAEEAR